MTDSTQQAQITKSVIPPVFAMPGLSPIAEAAVGVCMASFAERENARCDVSFRVSQGRSAEAAQAAAELEARVLVIVAEKPGATYQDVRTGTGRGMSRTKDVLCRMAGAGKLRREKHPRTGAALFYLPEAGQ